MVCPGRAGWTAFSLRGLLRFDSCAGHCTLRRPTFSPAKLRVHLSISRFEPSSRRLTLASVEWTGGNQTLGLRPLYAHHARCRRSICSRCERKRPTMPASGRRSRSPACLDLLGRSRDRLSARRADAAGDPRCTLVPGACGTYRLTRAANWAVGCASVDWAASA